MKILSIETSCDETAVSVTEGSTKNNISVLSNIVSSQVKLHAKWGGVVPNLAAREHTKNIIPVLTEALEVAGVTKNDIDLLAVTHGPGLIPALLSGVSVAKSISYSWEKPLIGIHHIEGHIYANWLYNFKIQFPVLALVVSGGHTHLILMRDHCQYEIVGQTQDDAVGEAFDKVARILGLGYPGGPIISERAEIFEKTKKENDIILPQPMKGSGNYNFSFSRILTAVSYLVKNYRKEAHLSDEALLPEYFVNKVAHAFQVATTEILTNKTIKAAKKYNVKTVLLAGGVSANKQLRDLLEKEIGNNLPHTNFSAPKMEYCLDNAAMIGAAAYYRYNNISQNEKNELKYGWKTLEAHAQHSINS